MAGPEIRIETVEPHYPALQFFVRHGHPIAALCGLAVLLAGVWLVLEGRMALVGLVASAVGGCVIYLLVRVFWDMAKLIADTMIPK
jgi:hypothetical protein